MFSLSSRPSGASGPGRFGIAASSVVERGLRRLLDRLQLRHRLLDRGDFGLQRLDGGGVLARGRRADLLRGRVPPLLRLLQVRDRRAAAIVERQQLGGAGRQAAAREPRVESGGIVADGPDVVHVPGPRRAGSATAGA